MNNSTNYRELLSAVDDLIAYSETIKPNARTLPPDDESRLKAKEHFALTLAKNAGLASEIEADKTLEPIARYTTSGHPRWASSAEAYAADARSWRGKLRRFRAMVVELAGDGKEPPGNKGGRPSVPIEDEVALLDEYDEGMLHGRWKSQKDFAEHTGMSEGKVSGWLKDARAKREQDPEFMKRSGNSPE